MGIIALHCRMIASHRITAEEKGYNDLWHPHIMRPDCLITEPSHGSKPAAIAAINAKIRKFENVISSKSNLVGQVTVSCCAHYFGAS